MSFIRWVGKVYKMFTCLFVCGDWGLLCGLFGFGHIDFFSEHCATAASDAAKYKPKMVPTHTVSYGEFSFLTGWTF